MSKEKFLAEADVMKSLRHPNVVLLLAICDDDSDMFIVTEFMDKGGGYVMRQMNKVFTLRYVGL